MPAISGSFVRGNSSGRAFSVSAIFDRFLDVSSSPSVSASFDRFMDASTPTASMVRDRVGEAGVHGYLQGIAYEAPTSYDGMGGFGRHMQIGVNKDSNVGSPSPSLRLDSPGFWRFRWVVRSGLRQISVLAQQNSTGSFRPSIIVKANSNVGLNSDISASAGAGSGFMKIGPLSFTATGTDVVWVELHNNNYGVANLNGSLVPAPVYFDHITVA